MQHEYQGQSLVTGHPFTVDVRFLNRPPALQGSHQALLRSWFWLGGTGVCLALARLWIR